LSNLALFLNLLFNISLLITDANPILLLVKLSLQFTDAVLKPLVISAVNLAC
jgi:hypothetical protein